MIASHGYAAYEPKAPLAPFTFERRDPREQDVVIEILYCGVCHSDLHQVNEDWGKGKFPMVPGHEIVGRVVRVGSGVDKFKPGDFAGVGCLVDSCRVCVNCDDGMEHWCENGAVGTYNSLERDRKTLAQGGYSNNIVVDQRFALKIPPTENLAAVAPLLCAGITTYSPLRHWKVTAGQSVGVVGLGGLGHMAVKLAVSFGARVVLFTTSPGKAEDGLRLGAHEVVLSTDREQMKAQAGRFDLILDTVSAPHDLNPYLKMLKRDATMTLLGLPDQPPVVNPGALVFGRRRLSGSGIGGLPETQEMLDYCAEHGIVSDIELIPIQKIGEAYERMVRGDVKYRFVIDMASLGA